MPQNKPHGIGGIVRHGEGMDVEVPDLKGGPAGEEAAIGLHAAFAKAVRGEWVCENRDGFFGAESLQPARVVDVFMREQDPRKIFGGRLQAGEECEKALRAEPRIDQNRSVSGLGKNGVSRAAAGEDGDIDHGLRSVTKNALGVRVEDLHSRQGLQSVCRGGRAFCYEKSLRASQRWP